MYKLWRKYVNGELSKACQIAAFPIYKWTKTMKFLRTKLVSSFKSRHSQSKTQARHKSSERIVLIGKTNIGFFSLSKPCSFFLYYTGFQNAHQDWALEGRVSSQYWSQHLMSNNTQAYFGELSRSPSNEYDSPHSSSQLLDRKSPSIWKWKGFNCTIPHIPWWQYNLKLFHNKVKNYFIFLFFSRKGAK